MPIELHYTAAHTKHVSQNKKPSDANIKKNCLARITSPIVQNKPSKTLKQKEGLSFWRIIRFIGSIKILKRLSESSLRNLHSVHLKTNFIFGGLTYFNAKNVYFYYSSK